MKQEALELSEDLIDFIESSPSAFHCVLEIEKRLKKAGFFPLKERDSWEKKAVNIMLSEITVLLLPLFWVKNPSVKWDSE